MSLRRMIILSSHIRLHFLGILLMFFCQNLYLLTVKEYNFVFIWCWFHLTILSMNFEECKSWSPLLCSFLWPPLTSCVIGHYIPLISLFSKIHSQSFSFCKRSVCCNLLLLSGLHNNTVMNSLIKKTEVVDLLTLQYKLSFENLWASNDICTGKAWQLSVVSIIRTLRFVSEQRKDMWPRNVCGCMYVHGQGQLQHARGIRNL